MHTRFLKYVWILAFPAFAVLTACDERHAGPTSPDALQSALVTAEPLRVTPEFVTGTHCFSRPPFGVRLVVTVGSGLDFVAQRLRFDFTDNFGRSAIPLVTLLSTQQTGSNQIPTSMPIPIPESVSIPGAFPIPIPGSSSADGMSIPGGASRRLPFFLEFGCGVPAAGTLDVSLDGTMRGTSGTSHVRVRVG